VHAVERWQWWREEEAGVEAAEDKTNSSGIDGGGVESGGDLESDGDLESFGVKRETTWDGLLFIGSKISAVVLN
jgi:hypothetical protein